MPYENDRFPPPEREAPTGAPLVPYRITICGLAELDDHAAAGISHVVSILDPEWPDPEAFQSYPPPFSPHRHVVWRFEDVVRVRDGVVAPQVADVRAIFEWADVLQGDRADHVLIHCHAGISRSTATAAILMSRNHPGREPEAFDAIWQVRPRSWPNTRMIEMADRLLERDGALVDALRHHQRRVAADYPDLANLLKGTDRAHEVLGL